MTPPTSDSAGLLRVLQDLRIGFEIVTERVAKASRLNPRDLSVLDVLHAEGPATPKTIADRTGIQPTTLTAVLTRLERDGRVNRYRNPQDARSSMVAVTEQTVHELARLYADVNDNLTRSFTALAAPDRAVIVSFLQGLVTTIHEAHTSGPIPPRPPTSQSAKPSASIRQHTASPPKTSTRQR
jgi:DNA-binding MarR family transcriptional regulator